MADNKFTFWDNMKETIEKYSDPVFKYKCYDALTEYGLYKVLPEDDGTFESQVLIAFCQGFNNALQTNWNFEEKKSEEGKKGGSKELYSDEQLEEVIKAIGIEKCGKSPTLQDLENKSAELYGKHIAQKTFTRRGYNKAKRDEIAKRTYEESIRKINNTFDF